MRVVYAALDDGRRHEHVDFVLLKLEHHVLDRSRTHLPMCDADAGLGRRLRHARDRVIYRSHTIAHIIDLTLAAQLATDGVRDHVGVPLAHRDLHGKASRRRHHDQAHVTHTAHGHLHGARDGRRRECQHVYLLAHVLELLLVLHAKALLLVYDDKTEVVRVHVRREQTVRSDEHAHRSVGKAHECASLLCRRHEA